MAEPVTPAAETPAAPSSGPRGSTLDVDSLIARHFGDDPAPAPATPKARAEPPEAAPDTPASPPADAGVTDPESVADGGDTPASPEEGGQTGEELEAEASPDDEVEALLLATEPEPEEVAEPSKPESFLPEFDRVKFLKEHPELEKPYKHMQAAFTRAQQQVAKLRRESEEKIERASAMEQQYNEFHEMLGKDQSFEDFLVQVSLSRPEVIERAYERAAALHEDEGKKDAFQQKLELDEAKRKLADREQREEIRAREQRTVEIVTLTRRVADRLGLKGEDDLALAEEFVAKQILQNHANSGKRDVTSEEIVLAVRRAATILGRKSQVAHRNGKKEAQQRQLRAQQDRLREPARPAPPAPAAPAAAPAGPKRINNAPKQPAVDSWIDQQLGLADKA